MHRDDQLCEEEQRLQDEVDQLQKVNEGLDSELDKIEQKLA